MEDKVYAVEAKTVDVLIGFFDNLVRSETRLYNALSDALRAEQGIGMVQFEFLRHLGSHADARVGDVAATFAVGVGATSKAFNRLEQEGWVRREPDPADRRSSFLRLTDSGRSVVDGAEAVFRRELVKLVGQAVSKSELGSASRTLGRLRGFLESGGLGTPVG
nr:MarR family [uncultured organism]